jgi:hypothetical protein
MTLLDYFFFFLFLLTCLHKRGGREIRTSDIRFIMRNLSQLNYFLGTHCCFTKVEKSNSLLNAHYINHFHNNLPTKSWINLVTFSPVEHLDIL